MRVAFTKMQGAGNDFVVLDETRQRLGLRSAQYRYLGDRHFGVGADQILTVRPSPAPGIDFAYVIHNADGQEVEHCGNGARCFLKFVHDRGLTTATRVRVQTMNRVLDLRWQDSGLVEVDMAAPEFVLERIPFLASGQQALAQGNWEHWPLEISANGRVATVFASVLSMGNPHAVVLVDNVVQTDVAALGRGVQQHPAFLQGVNVGFMQIELRNRVHLRVYERGAGETLACGTGACAAVVAGIRLGLLDQQVAVVTRGGVLDISWAGGTKPVMMAGPATTVFVGEIELPEDL